MPLYIGKMLKSAYVKSGLVVISSDKLCGIENFKVTNSGSAQVLPAG
jgi:hypothetical protein